MPEEAHKPRPLQPPAHATLVEAKEATAVLGAAAAAVVGAVAAAAMWAAAMSAVAAMVAVKFAMPQSLPPNPARQRQPPTAHTPPLRQGELHWTMLHAAPVYDASHTHVPLTQTPWPKQSPGQRRSEQS